MQNPSKRPSQCPDQVDGLLTESCSLYVGSTLAPVVTQRSQYFRVVPAGQCSLMWGVETRRGDLGHSSRRLTCLGLVPAV
jgi:hypothetical protein